MSNYLFFLETNILTIKTSTVPVLTPRLHFGDAHKNNQIAIFTLHKKFQLIV
jgi:hypothetical protein